MTSRLPWIASTRRLLTARTLLASGVVLLSAGFGLHCAIGSLPRDADASTDATIGIDNVGDSPEPIDTPTPPSDAFPCTGTTCTVANGMGACINNRCQIGSCNSGYSDLDRNPINGCECATGTVSSNCGTPTDLGMMAAGGMRSVMGLLPTMTAEHWIRVSFAPGGHARVRFMTNPGMAYKIDVRSSCMPTSGLSCTDHDGGASAILDYEFFDNPGEDGGMNNDLPARMTTAPGTTLIRVSRTGNATECMQYVLQISN